MNLILRRNRLVILATVIWTFLTCPGLLSQEKVSKSDLGLPPAGKPTILWNRDDGQAVLTNGPLELTIETKPGVNARLLRNTASGELYADRDYSWPGGEFPRMEKAPAIAKGKDRTLTVRFKGLLDSILVEQTFTAPGDEPGVILESITIRNPSTKAVVTADFRCGFTKRIREDQAWSQDAGKVRICPVPYRRETNGAVQDFPLREVAEHRMSYAGWAETLCTTPVWGAEGWVWSSGAGTLLLAKHNPDGMEWSLMEPLKRRAGTDIRFGGAGQWKHGHPEGSTELLPGKSYRFGETRFQAIDGDWKQAYYAYRHYLDSKGCKTPKEYNPPVHWNELYDNEYYSKVVAMCDDYFGPSKPGFCPEFYKTAKKLLDEYYSLELMKAEAAKARELGCEALYLDPGWDIGGPDLHVWDAGRLGPMGSFVKMVRNDYGLKGVSLWCSLGGVPPTIGDPTACPLEARVLTRDGKKADLLVCCPSPGFLDTKEKRLLELCRNGASFLMFDSDQYSGPCYDKTHGHSIPSTREEHAKALFELARRVKKKYPHVLIEMHDPITGPSSIHYTPTYYGYAPPRSFDCLWGHEFMWSPMDDLLSGRAISLYYYNLAYSIPLYLHVNLKQDNENALVFWWYASTCRHLGVGGKPGSKVWEAEKQAMRTYLGLKRFYTRGVFYGIEETVHAHTLPDIRESVLDVFNLGDQPAEKAVRIRLSDIGLPAGPIQVGGAAFTVEGDEITLTMPIPPRGHQLVKIRAL